MTKKITMLILLLVSGYLMAQNAEESSQFKTASYGGFGGFMLGGAQTNLSSLNSNLRSHGYNEFDKHALTTGGGGWGIIKNILIGGEGHSYYGLSTSGDNQSINQKYKMSLKLDYGVFDIGYIFYRSRNLDSYVMGGIGHSKIEFKITENETKLLNELLNNPKRDLILNKDAFLTDLSIGVNYKYHFGAILFIGLKTGYVFAFNQDDNENNILDCPAFGPTGGYAKLFIGFGGGFL